MPTDYLKKLFGFDGQTVVVIGGTGALGGTLCEGLAQAGAHVVVAGRNAERGNERVAAIKKLGGSASFGEVDATSRASIQALLDATIKERSRVDALVNCAGVNSPTPLLEITEAEFHRIIDGNLLSTLIGCQVFGKHMIESGGGAILNIGSVTSFRPLSRVFTYSASKAGVLNLTRNVAHDFAKHKIRVNCLCPGFFPAEQNRKILDPSRVESILRHTPMGRLGDSPELIGAALLLLSPIAGSFITGEAIYVDGGFTSITI
jgi:NAD(P)-dependent dehydrogenase (short-subunit alcohol dehydrogenase family)